ncbi:hypothetical protein PV772_19210 [Pseudarthrobacter sp. CC12]|uniref:hypothetical protein n=1 Tax=Pseudarthrobacter sp. CC12 TaxID=3029193 RepID=UPI00326656B5
MARDDKGNTKDAAGDDAEETVMTSLRITKNQARSLELVSQLTGRTKADIHRQALDALFKEMTRPEAVEKMMNAHRENLERKQAELKNALPTN